MGLALCCQLRAPGDTDLLNQEPCLCVGLDDLMTAVCDMKALFVMLHRGFSASIKEQSGNLACMLMDQSSVCPACSVFCQCGVHSHKGLFVYLTCIVFDTPSL